MEGILHGYWQRVLLVRVRVVVVFKLVRGYFVVIVVVREINFLQAILFYAVFFNGLFVFLI